MVILKHTISIEFKLGVYLVAYVCEEKVGQNGLNFSKVEANCMRSTKIAENSTVK